jgi:hypothetical protein
MVNLDPNSFVIRRPLKAPSAPWKNVTHNRHLLYYSRGNGSAFPLGALPFFIGTNEG